jgi:hypothetical protein
MGVWWGRDVESSRTQVVIKAKFFSQNTEKRVKAVVGAYVLIS